MRSSSKVGSGSLGLLLLLAGCQQAQPEPPTTVLATPAVVALNPAWAPVAPSPVLIPYPKVLEVKPGSGCVLNEVQIPANLTPLQRQGLRELGLKTRPGALPWQLTSGRGPDPGQAQRPEGYTLDVDAQGLTLAARDERGFYYGLQTLRLLLRNGPLPAVHVEDWPTLSFRGLHWTGGARSGPFQRQLLEKVVASCKFNALVFETQYARWKSAPRLWHPERSTPLAELRQTVDCARAHGLEPIPLIQTLSHAGWFFTNGQHADLGNGYCYDPGNPKVYEALFPVLAECLAIFRPREMHLGHDELNGFHDGFLADTRKLHGWLRKRGVRTMIWGDFLLHPSDTPVGPANSPSREMAAGLRAGLPRDITIADWHYGPEQAFPSLQLFRSAGFPVVGCTGLERASDWANLRNLCREIAAADIRGVLHTTWAGYNFTPEIARGTSYAQLVTWLVAAENAWNAGHPHEIDFDRAFRQLWGSVRTGPARPGGAISLQGVNNAGEQVWGGGSTFPRGQATLDGTTWLLDGAVRFHPLESLELALTPRALARLHLLVATTFRGHAGQLVARLQVGYADGSQAELKLLYPKHVRWHGDELPCTLAPEVWHGRFAGAEDARVRDLTWTNPHPERPVHSLRILGEGRVTTLLLLGLTWEDP